MRIYILYNGIFLSTLTTIKEMVLAQFSINPDISLKDCQKVVKGLTKPNFYKIKHGYKTPGRQSIPKKAKAPGSVASTPLPLKYEDDPDELLLSTAIRMLNKPDPDPRWASILINANKAHITTKGEDKELQRLSINSLVEILKENLPPELSKEESNSLFDNSLKV